ncbi:outer membrane lipoprotein Blc-like [Amphiura filiformis]|uniref:outer membrane lipoprotein Blc-like n=1 Tax=Amphiura filiformis TaxID=82378 RepID=UPI003B211FB0
MMKSVTVCCLLFLVSSAAANSFDIPGLKEAPSTVSELELSQYIGRWYQVYGNRFVLNTFERQGTCITADYDIKDGKVTVFNAQNMNNPGGRLYTINGTATVPDPDQPGKLAVTFSETYFPFAAPYWVLKLGPVKDNQYQYAIVSDSIRLSLFVLTREPSADFLAKYDDEIQTFLQENGFTGYFNKPIPVVQTAECVYAPLDEKKRMVTNNKIDFTKFIRARNGTRKFH